MVFEAFFFGCQVSAPGTAWGLGRPWGPEGLGAWKGYRGGMALRGLEGPGLERPEGLEGHGLDMPEGFGLERLEGHGLDCPEGLGLDMFQGHGFEGGPDSAGGEGPEGLQGA